MQAQGGVRNPLISIAAGVIGWQLSRLVPWAGILFVVLAIPFGIGLFVGSRWLRSRPTARAIAVWSGLVTWFLPILGMFTAGAALAGQDVGNPSTRDRVLAAITLALSIGNGVLGTMAQRAAA
jgi:hypothetical protein